MTSGEHREREREGEKEGEKGRKTERLKSRSNLTAARALKNVTKTK